MHVVRDAVMGVHLHRVSIILFVWSVGEIRTVQLQVLSGFADK